jgi:hypothetical protein
MFAGKKGSAKIAENVAHPVFLYSLNMANLYLTIGLGRTD